MNTVTAVKPHKLARHGFTVNDRGGNVKVRARGTNGGTVLVFSGKSRPKLVHV